MFKKIGKAIRFLFLSAVWTAVLFTLSRFLMKLIWQFDILSFKQWNVIAQYWNNNGVIAGFSDYMFFVALILILYVWLKGIRKVNSINYFKLLLKPIEYFSNRDIQKYENMDTHVVIKNISVGEKLTIEDVIKDRIKKEKATVAKDAESLRKNISQKIMQSKE
ncbi:MAG: hypothetical protein E7016_03930 [Alphaproteobacteria bacterium]|nr:hypothetical protein [Alphaproteobacteria bacterium]